MSSSSTDKREVRKFGLVAFLFFGCLGALGLWRQKPFVSYLFCFFSFAGIGFVVFPDPLKPVYAGWLRVTRFIGKVVTSVILTLAYLLVITPSALIKRLFSGRSLPTG
jgi:hypothetical protein